MLYSIFRLLASDVFEVKPLDLLPHHPPHLPSRLFTKGASTFGKTKWSEDLRSVEFLELGKSTSGARTEEGGFVVRRTIT